MLRSIRRKSPVPVWQRPVQLPAAVGPLEPLFSREQAIRLRNTFNQGQTGWPSGPWLTFKAVYPDGLGRSAPPLGYVLRYDQVGGDCAGLGE